jgi:hypothetical protein
MIVKKKHPNFAEVNRSGQHSKVERLLRLSQYQLDKDVFLIDRAASQLSRARNQKVVDYLKDYDEFDDIDLGEITHAIALKYASGQIDAIENAIRDLENQLRKMEELKIDIKLRRRQMRNLLMYA